MDNPSLMRVYKIKESIVFKKNDEPFGELSNMATCFPLEVNSINIRTSEALYQVCRYPHLPDVQRLIIQQKSPIAAKMKSHAHKNQTRQDWQAIRVNVMKWCLRVKLAQHWSAFGSILLSTNDCPIVEMSRRDTFWGAKLRNDETLVGYNVLGRLLMELRELLKKDDMQQLKAVDPPSISNFNLDGQPIKIVTDELCLPDPTPTSGDNKNAPRQLRLLL